jgi:hypothetical protein
VRLNFYLMTSAVGCPETFCRFGDYFIRRFYQPIGASRLELLDRNRTIVVAVWPSLAELEKPLVAQCPSCAALG